MTREIDAQVAEKVFGVEKYWTVMFGGSHYGNFSKLEEAQAMAVKAQGDYKARIIPYGDEPEYSTDIAAAWQVVEWMSRKAYYRFEITSHPRAPWRVIVKGNKDLEACSDNCAKAICLAALAAVQSEGGKP